ncbi:helix-turn-helix domain-containing protein [Patescibacteria group bacterium]|nr:helix-turn-helix domain-containing protein [Patescibacteria group bacterium]
MDSDINSNSVYAFPAPWIRELAFKIISPIKIGESCTVIWFPETGKNINIKEIFSSTGLIKQVLKGDNGKSVFVPVDLSMVMNDNKILGFLQVMYLSLSKKTSLKRSSLLDKNEVELFDLINGVCEKITKRGIHVVFVINEVELIPLKSREILFQALSNIVFFNRNYIHTILNLNNMDSLSLLEKNEKTFSLIQNICFLPIPSTRDTEYFINVLTQRWKINLNKKQKKILETFYGNNLLLKAVLRIFKSKGNDSLDELLNEREIQLKMRVYFEELGGQEKIVLQKIIFGEEISDHREKFVLNYLIDIGLIKKNKKKFTIEQEILTYVIKENNFSLKFSRNTNQEIMLGVCNLKRLFTASEYTIFEFLFKNQNHIVSRDEIAKKLWGQQYIDRYSDWAIDKTISRIRAKLREIGVKTDLIKIYKRKGYQFNILL